jgi:hypothetical protein
VNNKILEKIVIKGYQSLRSEIHGLVKKRIESKNTELYDYYYKNYAEDVKLISEKLDVDFLNSETNIAEAKNIVGLYLIEEDIKIRLTKKKEYDSILKELGIKLKAEEIRITNGIENCECFIFFGSPMAHNWFSQNANNILARCDSEDENYTKLVKLIENIKANWDAIDPQEPLPSISVYKHLAATKVSEGIKDLIAKPSDK